MLETTTRTTLAALSALAGLTLAVPHAQAAGTALAQPVGEVAQVEPEWVVVNADDTVIRCGDRTRYYAVARLRRGTVLTLDGRVGEWGRVAYPLSTFPLIRADEVANPTQKQAGDKISLARPSGLLAPDASRGIAESWKSIYETPIATGTELEVVETLLDAEGGVAGYRVRPPANNPPRGFIQLDQVRKATADEIAKAKAARAEATKARDERRNNQTAAGDGQNAQRGTDSTANRERPNAPAQSTPAQSTPGDVDTTLLDPIVTEPPAGSTPDRTAQTEPERTNTAGRTDDGVDWSLARRNDDAPDADRPATQPAGQPASQPDASVTEADPAEPTDSIADASETETDPTEPPAPAEPAPEGRAVATNVATLTELEDAFQDARLLPREELDVRVDELLEEYRRVRENLPDNTEGRYVGERIDQRIAWLELRQDTRDARRNLSAAIDEADSSSERLADRIEKLQIERGYEIVGRVTVSTVYDGERLPRKLRIVSVGPLDAGRTIGYIREADADKARPHLGRVVGIRGRTAYDRASRLAVVVIDRIEPAGDWAQPSTTSASPTTE